MNWLKQTFRSAWVNAWYAFAGVVVLVAVLFVVARILLPFADQYNTELSSQLGELLNQPVVIKTLDAEWHGLAPFLVLKDVRLLDAVDEHQVLQLDKVRVGFDLFNSLVQWQPVFSDVTLVGVNLSLTRTKQGRISVAGIADSNGNNEDLTPFIGWLFSQGKLGLEDSDITWLDELSDDRKMHFSAVNVSLRNDGDRHLLNASVMLPRRLGKALNFKVDMVGDPLQTKDSQAKIYISGEDVRLAELLKPQAVAGVEVSVGSADFRVWASWENGQVQHVQGEVAADDLLLASLEAGPVSVPNESAEAIVPNELALERLAGQFLWEREKKGWKFDADKLMLSRKGRQWQPARVALGYVDDASGDMNGSPSVEASASFLQLEDVSQLLSLFVVGGDEVRQALLAVSPKGEISDARLSWQGGVSPKYDVYARLQKATVNAWQSIPAAENVDGQLWLNSMGGQVLVEHAAVTLDLPELFRWPLQIDELHGAVAWQSDDNGWRLSGRDLVAVNTDISSRATFDVMQDAANESPFVSLVVDFQDGDGSQVARYLPAGIMPEAAVNWLDKAIVSAQIVSGGVLFYGRTENFPFDDGDGKFEVTFRVENASLNYAEAWPPISNINAEVRFLGRGMTVEMSQGKIYSNEIQWADVSIPDMTAQPMLLRVDGEVTGATQDKLDYLVNSPPLYKAFARNLEGMSSGGNSLLHLDLDLPIGAGDQTTVSGWVDLQGNTLSIPPLGRVLSEVDGRLEFFQDGLKADEIHAELLGQTTSLSIVTDEVEQGRKVRINAAGLFNAPDFSARYFPVIKDSLSGDGEWEVSFEIPMGGDKNAQHVASLRVKTNLQGVEIRLPAPFNKKADDADSLELRVDFRPDSPPLLSLDYAGFMGGLFELGGAGATGVQRGEVRFNGGELSLPQNPELRFVGQLDTVSLDGWRNLWASAETPAKPHDQTSLIYSADLAVRVMEIYGQKFHNGRFKLVQTENGLRVDIDSEELKGLIQIPRNLQADPVRAVLTQGYFTALDAGGGSVDPRDAPALDIRIADFRYNDRQFGNFILETTRVADGMRIEQFVLRPPSTTITTRGGWYIAGDEQSSNIQMHVKSSDIGQSLEALGYVGGIDDGEGTLDLDIHWPGSFADVDASQIQGKLGLRLRDGHLLDIDPGAGRVFGLLSIQMLPRRLFLDFSDVFKKGFGFDIIEGGFSIDGGDAYTNNTYLDGPAARIEITGRTGLVQQDYDQLVTVIPHVGDSLPVITAITAAPQIGAMVLAFQKIFKLDIDTATQNQYTITGSWSAPIIEKVKRPAPAPEKEAGGQSADLLNE